MDDYRKDEYLYEGLHIYKMEIWTFEFNEKINSTYTAAIGKNMNFGNLWLFYIF